MFSLFPKFPSLTTLSYSSFKLAGLMNIDGKRWITLYMAYQWFIIHLAFITSVTELLVGGREMNHLVPTLSISVITIVIISKLYLFHKKRDQICNILNRLEDVRLNMLQNEKNVTLVAEAEKFGKSILLGLFLMHIGAQIPSVILNTVAEYMSNFTKKHQLTKIWLPWSRENNMVHVLSNGLITMMTIAIRFVYIGFYSMQITFTLYVSAYIKTLQNNLINKGIRNEDIYEQHKVIIQLINDYNEVLSGQMYFEILIAPLIPCGFALSFIKAVQKKDIGKTLVSCVRALTFLMNYFVSCCCGQEVITQAEKLHDGSYMTDWYKEEPKFRRNFLMMKIQTTKPTTVNYRLFVTFDYVLLTAVLQFIYSYFMLLINMDKE